MAGRNFGWIWLRDWGEAENESARLVYLRKEMTVDETPDSFPVRMSADTRYKLYINGQLCELGPSKGDRAVWYCDQVETAPFLRPGRNIWAVEILRYPFGRPNGKMSLFRTPTPGFYLESLERDKDGSPVFATDETWIGRQVKGFSVVSEDPFFAPLFIYERREGAREDIGWREADEERQSNGSAASDSAGVWQPVRLYERNRLPEILLPERLEERTIPFMNKIPRRFVGISRPKQAESDWGAFLAGRCPILIPAHTETSVDIDAGELMTGFLRLSLTGGRQAEVDLLQSECYVEAIPERRSYSDKPIKGDRSDASTGLLAGNHDIFRPSGGGTESRPERYEPFWLRTFRYIRLTVRTKDQPVKLLSLDYLETGYPLELKARVETSDETLCAVWEISERTLRRCMQETYTDCPFYEQLQYAMDSRSQILYTYAVSADDRLARKCMDDFRRSQLDNGLLQACYPSTGDNVIPGFSIYYIGMLYDHMMYFGDRELVERHLGTIDRILSFFHEHRTPRGIVDKIGDRNRPGSNWSFIDWAPEWEETDGVPGAMLRGPITMESLLYVLGLQYAAALCRFAERDGQADLYEERAEAMRGALSRCCRGEDGMIQDGPGIDSYSQHCQVYAVLTGVVSPEEGARYLVETLDHRERYAQCTVATMYYLFRALEKCDRYDRTAGLWDVWRDMVDKHLTTCAEDPMRSRSDCHAWGSLILYELPAVALGVRPSAPGFSEMEVNPRAGTLSWARGVVPTPWGAVEVSWEKNGESMDVRVKKRRREDCANAAGGDRG